MQAQYVAVIVILAIVVVIVLYFVATRFFTSPRCAVDDGRYFMMESANRKLTYDEYSSAVGNMYRSDNDDLLVRDIVINRYSIRFGRDGQYSDRSVEHNECGVYFEDEESAPFMFTSSNEELKMPDSGFSGITWKLV